MAGNDWQLQLQRALAKAARHGLGGAEVVGQAVSGLALAPGAGLRALAERDPGVVREVLESQMYRPRTEEGRAMSAEVEEAFKAKPNRGPR